MTRTIISVPEHDMEILDNICTNTKITRTAAIRTAIKDYIEKKSRNTSQAFGAFKNVFGDKDSVEIQRELRREWGK